MIYISRNSRRGFTLVELAIVLAVAGVLFVGLWRLLSGGNQQLRDQSAASSQLQLISAVKGYLASSEGQNLVLKPLNPNASFGLALPSAPPDGGANGPCMASIPTNPGLCNYLPVGFEAPPGANPTTNSYRQTFTVRVLKDNTPSGTVPNTYSFMVLTSGGDTIPDTDGGRITAVIGGDGGFVYSNDVCTAGGTSKTTACGAYGSWQTLLTNYGMPVVAPGGFVATRTYVSPEQDSSLPWLARNTTIQPDPTFNYNTMITDLYMGSATGVSPYHNINLAPFGHTTGGGTINLQGGLITGATTSSININGSGGINPNPPLKIITVGAGAAQPAVNIGTGCNKGSPTDATCQWGLQLFGDAAVAGLLQANAFYSNTVYYQTSDVRLKTNIHPLTSSLADIMRLKPVSFNFKSSGKESLGVIAQDIEKIYPELVTTGDGMKAVNYEGLIAPLISSVQELKKENDELRLKIDAQAARQEILERELHKRTP